MHMRDWLVAIRREKGYSQKEVADSVQIAQPSYCNIEAGKRRPSPEVAMGIAKKMGFDWKQFYEQESE